ncbi:sugar nucleotide-binding protein [Corynebacterium lizhenjunii]|uniref:sugar nucleotide-binding protein n=1 Tax=Corynebacterium lizhenjunii TaxID=2709394 RepID=UPI0013EBE00B|nr:bifunctional dTDP-4-dehydrorhamnose 3,5-epimerase family protein/NAD(P)-dependent oxidoreductase [Corynebacterium lizhenjunii]
MHTEPTAIPGLLRLHLDVHGDNRGWFKENWQREKMLAAGVPDFRPVQQNISFNADRGATRGLHAEPWDKLVSVAAGRVFGAWCDLREGSPTFGQLVTAELGPDTAFFVPRGVANGFQALEDATVYSYLVNDHWSPDAQYSMVNLSAVSWPLPPTQVSAKDLGHPQLADAAPMPPRRILVTGANGQLGRALRALLPEAEFCNREQFDVCNPPQRPWKQYEAIINCAAFNDVNGAESDRARAWEVNALAPGRLAAIAAEHNLTLVHVSSDYVFGNPAPAHAKTSGYTEADVPAPLSLYGASKAAGEAAAAGAPRHYIIRTSWVFGDGANFIATMASLARRGATPAVVSDQRGRPTFADDLAAGIVHLLRSGADYGIYNLSCAGDAVGRDEVAMATFIGVGADPAGVTPVTTAQYEELAGPQAPRPAESTLDLSKLEATGFRPRNWRAALALYLARLTP